MSKKVKVLSDSSDFNTEVLQSTLPVFVDFSATWCGPCKALEPILEKIAEEKETSCKVVKIDVDDFPELVEKYEIRSVPMVFLFKDGKFTGKKVVGLVSKEKILKLLEE